MTAMQNAKRSEVGGSTPQAATSDDGRSRVHDGTREPGRGSEQGVGFGLLLACVATLAIVLPAGLDVAGQPDAVDVLRDGHGVRRLRRRPAPLRTAMGTRSVADLTVGPDRAGRRQVVDLVAEKGRSRSPRAARSTATPQRHVPRPAASRSTEGELVEVHLRNEYVADGITLHWHGVDVPNAEDGVAGVTQDAVRPGEEHTYRFVADHAGTYWYHSHQVSHEQVIGGLLGPLVVHPADPDPGTVDVVALDAHLRRRRAPSTARRDVPVEAEPGQRVRVRVINTDNGPVAGLGRRALPRARGRRQRRQRADRGDRQGRHVTAGGRADLRSSCPRTARRCASQVGAATALRGRTRRRDGARGRPADADELDLLPYGTPAPLGFDPRARGPRRSTTPSAGGPASSTAGPGCGGRSTGTCSRTCRCSWSTRATWSMMRIDNHSGDVHPMHLHGHHAVVLVPRRREGDRQPVVGRLAQRQGRRDVRRRVRRRQPRHLDGPLPQPQRTPRRAWSRT